MRPEEFAVDRPRNESAQGAFSTFTGRTALDLIDQIYLAAAEREQWTGFCSALSAALGGAAVGVSLEHPRPGEKGIGYGIGFDPAYCQSFRTRYYALSPWEEPLASLPVGALAFGAHLVPDEVALRSEYYEEWMKPQGLLVGPTLCGVIGVHGAIRSYLSVHRPKGVRECGAREYALCRLLMPHLRRAIEFDRRFRSLEAEREIGFASLDQLAAGLFLVDAQGRILACNRIGDEMASRRDGLFIDTDGIAGATPAETRALRVLIHQAIRGEGDRGGSVSLRRTSGRPDLEARVTSLDGATVEGHRVAAVLVTDPTQSG
jgi:hypothetical protein